MIFRGAPGRPGARAREAGCCLSLLLLLLGAAGYFSLGNYPRTLPSPAPVSSPEGSSSAPSVQKSAGEAPVVVQPAASPASPQGQSAVVPVELPVIPATGAVVRMIPLAAGTMKISLDSQEVREYQLQTDQSLNWKVSASLAVELSAPGLARVWVDQQEIAVSEQAAFILKGLPKARGDHDHCLSAMPVALSDQSSCRQQATGSGQVSQVARIPSTLLLP